MIMDQKDIPEKVGRAKKFELRFTQVESDKFSAVTDCADQIEFSIFCVAVDISERNFISCLSFTGLNHCHSSGVFGYYFKDNFIKGWFFAPIVRECF